MNFFPKALVITSLLHVVFSACDALAFAKVSHQEAKLPSVMKADKVRADKVKNSMTASGNVEVTRGSSIIYADKVVYSKNKATFHAIGNVKIKNIEIGNVTASKARIKEDFSSGNFADTTLVLNDGSYLVSPEIDRQTPQVTDLLSAIYSVCPNPAISADNELAGKKRDMLSIKSQKVTIDRQEEVFKIKSGIIRYYNVPVLYMPYMKLPIPSSGRKSGFLTPSYSKNTRLGLGFTTPYYFNIAPNKELTMSPTFYPNTGQVLLDNEYHQLTAYGEYQTTLELANNKTEQSVNVKNATQSSKEYRWHLEGEGKFDFTQNTGADFRLDAASDRGYLRDYHNDFRAYSLSKVNVDYIKGRTYYGAKTLRIQEFEEDDVEVTKSDPLILPQIETHVETKPQSFNEKYGLTSNTTVITRESGLQYRRASLVPEFNIPINHKGNLFNIDARVQGDFYSLENNYNYSTATTNYSETETNYKPEFSAMWRLPLINRLKSNTIMVEPMANFVSSSYKRNLDEVPNEDSNSNELTINNLFNADRISGYDRNESGERVSYGAKSSIFTSHGEYGLVLGQSLKMGGNEQDTTIRGFNDNNKSNIVGMLSYEASPVFKISYSFHLDESNYRNEINEVITSLKLDRVTFGSNYLFLRQNNQNATEREQISMNTTIKINEKFSTKFSTIKNLVTGKKINQSMSLLYNGCCTEFGFSVTRSKPSNLLAPQRSYSFTITFKNL